MELVLFWSDLAARGVTAAEGVPHWSHPCQENSRMEGEGEINDVAHVVYVWTWCLGKHMLFYVQNM